MIIKKRITVALLFCDVCGKQLRSGYHVYGKGKKEKHICGNPSDCNAIYLKQRLDDLADS